MRLTVLTVPADQAELAADRLWAAGACAVEERPGDDGRLEVRTVLADDDETSRRRLGSVPVTWEVTFVDADDAPSQAWRDHVTPIIVNDDLVVVPAWLDGDAVDAGPDGRRTVIEIEPAGSFGLGDHPTTRLSCDAVWRCTRPGATVLDVGCGTGILAITAILRGAVHAVAVDVAEAAREATVANARRNGVAEQVDASCDPLAAIDGAFDLVVANILAPTLIDLADDLRRVTAPGGRLVLSGLLAERYQHVVEALSPLVVAAVHTRDAWACVELVRPAR